MKLFALLSLCLISSCFYGITKDEIARDYGYNDVAEYEYDRYRGVDPRERGERIAKLQAQQAEKEKLMKQADQSLEKCWENAALGALGITLSGLAAAQGQLVPAAVEFGAGCVGFKNAVRDWNDAKENYKEARNFDK